jgi:hypothetical protein
VKRLLKLPPASASKELSLKGIHEGQGLAVLSRIHLKTEKSSQFLKRRSTASPVNPIFKIASKEKKQPDYWS